MRHSIFATLLLGTLLVTGSCQKKSGVPVADQASIDKTSTAASAARNSSRNVSSSRDTLARNITANSVDLARESAADALFVSRRDEVLAQGRANLLTVEVAIAELRARAARVQDPDKLRSKLAAVTAAQPLASAAVDAIAVATPDTWDVRRKSVESTFAELDVAYKGAVDAAR